MAYIWNIFHWDAHICKYIWIYGYITGKKYLDYNIQIYLDYNSLIL